MIETEYEFREGINIKLDSAMKKAIYNYFIEKKGIVCWRIEQIYCAQILIAISKEEIICGLTERRLLFGSRQTNDCS